jgi:hypothetical protein
MEIISWMRVDGTGFVRLKIQAVQEEEEEEEEEDLKVRI